MFLEESDDSDDVSRVLERNELLCSNPSFPTGHFSGKD